MENQKLLGLGSLMCLVFLAIALTSGCGKQTDEPPAAASPDEPTQPQAGTPQPSRVNVAAEKNVSEVQQAVKNKDYDRALEMLLAPPLAGNPPTPEQAAQLNAAMSQLQAQLAAAAAAGDAKAIAAREKLRLHSLRMP